VSGFVISIWAKKNAKLFYGFMLRSSNNYYAFHSLYVIQNNKASTFWERTEEKTEESL